MPKVFYLPGTDSETSVTDAATGTVFTLDEFGRAVADLSDKDAAAFLGRSDCWVEGQPAPGAPARDADDEALADPQPAKA